MRLLGLLVSVAMFVSPAPAVGVERSKVKTFEDAQMGLSLTYPKKWAAELVAEEVEVEGEEGEEEAIVFFLYIASDRKVLNSVDTYDTGCLMTLCRLPAREYSPLPALTARVEGFSDALELNVEELPNAIEIEGREASRAVMYLPEDDSRLLVAEISGGDSYLVFHAATSASEWESCYRVFDSTLNSIELTVPWFL